MDSPIPRAVRFLVSVTMLLFFREKLFSLTRKPRKLLSYAIRNLCSWPNTSYFRVALSAFVYGYEIYLQCVSLTGRNEKEDDPDEGVNSYALVKP